MSEHDTSRRRFSPRQVASLFVLIAVVAHWAVWQWRPWIPGVSGYTVTSAAPATGTGATVVASTP